MSTGMRGKTLTLDIDRDLTPQQRHIARGLANAEPIHQLAEQLGITEQRAQQIAKGGPVLASIGSMAIANMHGTAIPVALKLINSLIVGCLLEAEVDGKGRKRLVEVKAPVPAAVRLAAAQYILKLSKIEEDAPAADLDEDLANASPDRLRAIVSAIESQIAKTAVNVTPEPRNAPNDIEEAEVVQAIPDGYSVLD